MSRRSQDHRSRHNSVACGAGKLTTQKAATSFNRIDSHRRRDNALIGRAVDADGVA